MRGEISDMARDKKGQILTLALLVMFVGAIILAGLFQYLGSSLLLATRGEENAVNYYAADSGIEDALYGLTNNQSYEQMEYILQYTNNADNNRIVNVSVVNDPEGLGDTFYKITSIATHNKSGASTTIESYIKASPIKFWEFGKDAITSNCSVELKTGHGSPVQGNITYVCDVDCGLDGNPTNECPEDGPNCCEQSVNGSMNHDPDGIDWWPETWAIKQYFGDEAEDQGAVHITGDAAIDVALNASFGPLYVDGDLYIYSSDNHNKVSATLGGIIYITGDLDMGGFPSSHPFYLNLSDQVIFVESEDAVSIGDVKSIVSSDAEVFINNNCDLKGSGAIFAIGDIWFHPSLATGSEDFIYIMSLDGWLHMQPNGQFYGSIAANKRVELQPSYNVERTEGEDLWNTFNDPKPVVYKVLTYDIIDR